ncbi:MAG: carbohydrate binding family 9 domain-containing protein, partial [Candidatus Aminicenantes bacterium]|nr:carbohydrate binding family 9 domain-containing protein [Candidatus Aminicenantes bacterium]
MRRRIFYLGIFLLVTLLLSHLTLSEEKILKIPRLTSPPKIDGILENPVWEQEALKIEEFLQFAPKEKGTPSEKTVAYLGYDQKNLYIAIRCYDSEPQKIRASITNRDNLYDDDWVVIFLDTFNERRRAFEFFINPVGVQGDAIRTEEGGNENESDSWDTAFYTDGKINEEGYTIEMALPFKSIRFPDKENKVWNIAIGRNIPRKGEIITWPGMSREIPGLIVQGREFLIQGKVEKGKNLEVMPLITSLKTQDEKVDLQPGVNLKYGVSSDITLDFTLNPDFSHIEADAPQIDINQRFALYYSEKRPFFLEGMEIFQFPEIEMVYTRRIINPFLGAKLTGKVGRLTYGFLSAYDLNPTESLW